MPTNLSASVVSSSQINLSWTASTDNVGVAGYQVFRNGSQIAATSATSYADTGLSPSTAYSYTVAAYDAAGNVSLSSGALSVTILNTISASSAGTAASESTGTTLQITGVNAAIGDTIIVVFAMLLFRILNRWVEVSK